MKRTVMIVALALLPVFSINAQTAATVLSAGTLPAGGGVIADVPAQVWNQGQNATPPPCQRCCIYDNRNYSEGAVLKAEGVLLQCSRDPNVLSTNNLSWHIISQSK